MFSERQAKKNQQKPQSLSAIQRQEEEDYNGYSSPGEAYANRPIPKTGFDYMQLLRVPQADKPIQAKADESVTETVSPEAEGMGTENEAVIQEKSEEKPNLTGLPDNLKAGVENLSGYSLDDVRVHYNSPKPAQLQALAYTQGTEIHVASGQEKHLPHEAWHVVQQMQGRVKPTMQMKGVQINDDEGLEREADSIGYSVFNNKQIRPQESLVLNSKKSSAVSINPIQLFVIDQQSQVILIKQYEGTKNWTKETLDQLTQWAANFKQIKRILGKPMSYEEWDSIRFAYPDASKLKGKIQEPDVLLNPDQTPKGDRPTIEQLRGYTYHWAKKANPVEPNQTLKELITNQRKYETVISQVNKEDKTSIMDKHRTMGIELEFAHYAGYDLGEHTELAVSNDSILKTVPGEWVLETDNNKKLEIGVPPMYVIDIETGDINIQVITAIRTIVKTALETARDKYKNSSLVKDFVAGMPEEGMGENWQTKPAMPEQLAFQGRTTQYPLLNQERVSENLGLHSGQEQRKYMYEQINLSMTAKEIAKDIEAQKKHEEELRGRSYDWLGQLASTILAYLDENLKDKGLESAKVLMSKGLAGIGSLPDIIHPSEDGVHSSVKEIFGIWIKDNTPNLVVSAAMDSPSALQQLLAFTDDRKRRKKGKKSNRATKHAQKITEMIISKLSNARQQEYWQREVQQDEKTAIQKEVKATLLKINDLIKADHWIENPDVIYGNENFDKENGGLGVRKDTYVNIPSGDKRKLHLAEIRSDWTIDRFTKEHKT